VSDSQSKISHTPGAGGENVGTAGTANELRDMLVEYAKQETLGPLQRLAKWAALGLGGVVFISLGMLFFAVAALRALQTETGSTFTGNWSWAPYAIVLVGVLIVIAITMRVMSRRPAERSSS
jgi:hypothetical protein